MYADQVFYQWATLNMSLKSQQLAGQKECVSFCLEIKSQAVSAEDDLECLVLWSTLQKSQQPQPHEWDLSLLWQSSGMQSRSGKVPLTAWTRRAPLLPHFFLSEILSWASSGCLSLKIIFYGLLLRLQVCATMTSLIQVSWSRYF